MSVRRPIARATARAVASLATAALVASGLVAAVAAPASADTQPPSGLPATVSADALPTVQHNGVVWQTTMVGDTVYAGGDFTRARPAGAALGTQEVVRNNLLSFDVRNGVLDSGWAPNPNGGIRAVVRSPDGKRLYIGGTFTNVAGQARYRIAAFDTATGALVASFKPGTNSQVRAIAATNTTVYVGGTFTEANSTARTRLAAFDATTGALLPWAPTVEDGSVSALTVAPDGRTVIVGGNFRSFNGSASAPDGLARVDAVTGAALSFPATTLIRNGGSSGSILGLAGDADHMYGVGYTFGRSGGTLEGVFAADWDTGELAWVADCHGDTYAVHPQGDVIYTASHHHYCGNIGGMPQYDEWRYYRAGAFAKNVTSRVGREPLGYSDFEGQQGPAPLHWTPDLDTGTYTGQNQGPWAVTGDDRYVVMGGEFLNANFRRQQGLVRYAVRSLAPNDEGPRYTGADFTPTARAVGAGAVRVSWTANADFDNEHLTYTVLRNGQAVWSGTKPSVDWRRPVQGYTDTGLTTGATYTYEVRVADPFGNTVTSPSVTATADGTGAVSAYALAVANDGAEHHWRFDEKSTGQARDSAATLDANTGSGITRGTAGAIAGDANTAYTLAGNSNSRIVAAGRKQAWNEMSVEAWVRTTSTRGGWVVGFGSGGAPTGNSTYRDRQLYVDANGRVQFGASPNQNRTVRSPSAVNDGKWHHLVGTMDGSGMKLYVDGQLAAARADNRNGRNYSGYWRIGGDNLSGWPNRPAGNEFNGAIDEVAVYPHPLSAQAVATHYALGTGGQVPKQPPAALIVGEASGLSVNLDASTSSAPEGALVSYEWDFGDGATGSGAQASHTYGAAGTYVVTLTVTDDQGQTAVTTWEVTVTAPPPNQAPTAAFTATADGLGVTVDGSGSTDADGTVASFAWDFGDGGTASGATAQHTYGEAGTYTVTLTVTDDDGATGASTQEVTVSEPMGEVPVAADAFGRDVTGGWGNADVGGAWALTGGAANFSVAQGVGAARVVGAGYKLQATLPVQSTSTDLRVDVELDVMPTGAGTDLDVIGRAVSANDGYRARLKMLSTGVVRASLLSTQGNAATTLRQVNVPGLTYAAGQKLSVRLQVDGVGTTQLRLKVWPAGTAEPEAWTITVSDSTAAYQVPGGVGLMVYTSASTTTLPLTARWSNLVAGPVAH